MAPTDSETNPYAAPTARVRERHTSSEHELASYGDRLLGIIVDTIAGAVPIYAVLFLTMGVEGLEALANSEDPDSIDFAGFAPMLLTILVLFLVQVFLLATRSQSIGKLVMGTRIDEDGTDHRAGPMRTIVLRILVFGAIAAIPLLGVFVALADPLFIFAGDKKQCLHDRIAKTVVRKIR